MPTPIDQIQLNSEDPAASYDNLTAGFYHNLINAANALTGNDAAAQNITAVEMARFEVLREQNQNAFHNIMLDDQSTFHNLEDQAIYKAAIDPRRLQSTQYITSRVNALTTQLRNPNLTDNERITLQQQLNEQQQQYAILQTDAIHAALLEFKNRFEASFARLKEQQNHECQVFNAQLNDYIARLPNNNAPNIQAFAAKQRETFLTYQQQQLNHLQALYKERQQNFLNRVNNVENDLSLLRSNGKTEQEAREALVQPSTYGQANNPEGKSALERQYYSIPCGPKAEDRIQYEITLKGRGSQQTAHIHFDTVDIPFRYRLDAWNTAFDKLLASDKNHFDLMSCSRSFPILPHDERYRAKIAMAIHIWEKNPNATIEPGELPGKDPVPGGNNHTGYYKQFIDLQRSQAAREKLQEQSRVRNGLPAQKPNPTEQLFNVPILTPPGNIVNPLEIERNRNQTIGFHALPNPVAGGGNPGAQDNPGEANEQQIIYRIPGVR